MNTARRHTGSIVGSVFLLLAALAVVLSIGLAWYSLDPVQRQRRTEQARLEIAAAQLAQQQRAFALERQQLIDQTLAPIDVGLALFWRILPTLAALLIVGGVAWYLFDRYRLARRLVWADAAGRLPMPRREIEIDSQPAQATIAAYHTTTLAAASRPVLPEHLTYAPKLTSAAPAPALPEIVEDGAAQLAPSVPTFRELLQRGEISQGSPLILGVAGGELLRGDWTQLYTCAVAGVGGTGKSTTVRFAACQAVLHGARFVVLDRHMDGGEDESLAQTLAPLQRHMLCAPAADDQDVLKALALVKAIGDARKHGRDRDRTPVLLCVDEFTSYMSRSTVGEPLAALLEEIAQELRKFKVFAMIAGHVWTASRSGGSELRASLASAYVHRIRPDQARYLLGMDKKELPDLLHLPQGSAYLYTTRGELQMVQIPNCTAGDVQYVADLLSQPTQASATDGARYLDMLRQPGAVTSFATATPAPSLLATQPSPRSGSAMPADMPRSSQQVATADAAYSALESDRAVSAEALHAARLFHIGKKTPAEIVRELRQIDSSQGKRYQTALAEILDLIRDGTPGLYATAGAAQQ